MPVDREILKDVLDLQIGINELADAAGFETVASTPVGTKTPDRIGHLVFVSSTKQFFIAVGTTSANWQAMTAAT